MIGRAVAGVVLTGGASSRMGTEKALIAVGGRPLAVRVADALWEAGCHPVWCQGGDPDALADLHIDVVADTLPGEGPVPAILDALRRADGAIVVAACDLVDLDAAAVRSVIKAPGADVAVATSEGRPHLLSRWSPAAEPSLARLVAAGIRAYREAVATVGAVEVPVAAAVVRNVNQPGDLG